MPALTLNAYLEKEVSDPSLADLVDRIASACWRISSVVRDAALTGHQGQLTSKNSQGDTQKPLDLIADEIFSRSCLQNPDVAVLISEEQQDIYVKSARKQGDFAVAFDPLDGSSNLDVDLSVGSIFSISRLNSNKDLMPLGRDIICAGYAIYGPSVMLVLTFGHHVSGFTLDVSSEEFMQTHPRLNIPPTTQEFAINMSREPYWDRDVQRYIRACVAGSEGPREKPFNMRWTASMVADVHRILMRGGVFLYPKDSQNASQGGKLRLLYEAYPMALITQAAGGQATNGHVNILDIEPTRHHERTAVFLGASEEIELLSKDIQAVSNKGRELSFEA